MKIVIAGGQTGGPIIPLLAVVQQIKKQHHKAQVIVVDTPTSTARHIAEKLKYHFYPLTSGKLRRYWSFKTMLAPAMFGLAFVKSLRLLRSIKPNIVLGAGGFVQVPVIWAAWLCRIPVIIHQQDLLPSLSNTLSAPFATKITVTFEESLKDFYSGTGLLGSYIKKPKKTYEKVHWTGNPFRDNLKDATREQGLKFYKLHANLPVVLVLGGATGAQGLNDLIYKTLPKLQNYAQVIHVTGKRSSKQVQFENYQAHEFLDNIDLAYAVADIVISRAGISTITELCQLKKITILVPMPNTHQEYNAMYLYDKGAAIPMDQLTTTPEHLLKSIRGLLLDGDAQKLLKANMANVMPKNSGSHIAKLVLEIAENGK